MVWRSKAKLLLPKRRLEKLKGKQNLSVNHPNGLQLVNIESLRHFFGVVKRLKVESSPKNLVLQILGAKLLRPTTAMQWGI